MTTHPLRYSQMAHRTKHKQRGAGYIEVLVSSLILSLSILAALSLYGFSMNMITRTGDEGVAYNIARRALENARQLGFKTIDGGGNVSLPDGTITLYYDSLGADESATKGTRKFKMVEVVTSTVHVVGTNIPAPDALRTVKITVSYADSGEQIEQTGTVLVRSGV